MTREYEITQITSKREKLHGKDTEISYAKKISHCYFRLFSIKTNTVQKMYNT